MAERKYWLFKSEPTAYSFSDLLNEPNQTAEWDGIRNYQVRNLMRDEMKVGDGVLFYHSSAKPMAIMGSATIVGEAYPDSTSWDPDEETADQSSGCRFCHGESQPLLREYLSYFFFVGHFSYSWKFL